MQDITAGQLLEKKGLLDHLRRFLNLNIKPEYEQSMLYILQKFYEDFFCLETPEIIPEIQRVTVNRRLGIGNSRLNNVSFLKYPPENKVAKYGRCNIHHKSVLYASFDPLTIFSELKPEVGDLVTVSHWKNRGEIPMRCFSIMGNQPHESINLNTWELQQAFEKEMLNFPPNIRELFKLQADFTADAFSKFIQPGAHLDYIFSAYFAGIILGDRVGADALRYPSVQQKLSFDNIAIVPAVFERTFHLKEATEMVVVGSPYGESRNSSGSFSKVTATAKSIQADGQLDWINSPNTDMLAELERDFGVSFS